MLKYLVVIIYSSTNFNIINIISCKFWQLEYYIENESKFHAINKNHCIINIKNFL